MGGEKRTGKGEKGEAAGSPPRGRGKVIDSLLDCPQRGITPALAGKSAESSGASGRERDHPRVGGEKISFFFTGCSPRGSPPRGRGKVPAVPHRFRDRGITPAWAGKSFAVSGSARCARDHPRVGGEKGTQGLKGQAWEGSPPRWRGKVQRVAGHLAAKGITPAWAGKRPASQPWSPPLWMMVIRPRP